MPWSARRSLNAAGCTGSLSTSTPSKSKSVAITSAILLAVRPEAEGVGQRCEIRWDEGIILSVEGLTTSFSIVGAIALLFGLGIAFWRLTMLLGWKRRRATVVSYLRQRAYRGSSYVKVTVRWVDADGKSVEATDTGPSPRPLPTTRALKRQGFKIR